MSQELDRVVVAGDGVSEPEGISVASGTIDATAGTPTTGPLTLTDVINLQFGTSKAYRIPQFNPRFIMTDTQYKNLRSVATGVTGDTRTVFGMDFQSYMLGGEPVAIEQVGLSNNQLIFGALKKHRLYRRKGLGFIFDSTGQTNRLANTSRYGSFGTNPTTRAISYDATEHREPFVAGGERGGICDKVAEREAYQTIAAAVSQLSPTDRDIVSRWTAGETFGEIGLSQGVGWKTAGRLFGNAIDSIAANVASLRLA